MRSSYANTSLNTRVPEPNYTQWVVLGRLIYWTVLFTSSPAVAYLLGGLKRCVFIDDLLHTTVVMRDYLSPSCQLWLVWPLSLTTRFCPQHCGSLDVYCFSHHSLQTLETLVWKAQEIRSFCDTESTRSGTNNHSTVKVTLITFHLHSHNWSEKPPNVYTMTTFFNAFSYHMIGWLNISLKLVHRST